MSELPVEPRPPSRVPRSVELERRLWRAALERWVFQPPRQEIALPPLPEDSSDEHGGWNTFWFRTIAECSDLIEPYLAAAADEALERFQLPAGCFIETLALRALGAISIRIGPGVGRREEIKIVRFMSQCCRSYLRDTVRDSISHLLSEAAVDIPDEGLDTFTADVFNALFYTGRGEYPRRILYVENILENVNNSDHAPEVTQPHAEVVPLDAEARKAEELAAMVGELAVRARQVEDANRALDLSVSNARAAGATWALIGETVGISQQAANARWNPDVKKQRAAAQRRRLRRDS